MNESNFGNILREARERSGEDLMSVARKLRIRPDILESIEAGDLSNMPPRGYSRNMINAYARYLGLNPTNLVDAYLSQQYQDQVERARKNIRPTGFDMPSAGATMVCVKKFMPTSVRRRVPLRRTACLAMTRSLTNMRRLKRKAPGTVRDAWGLIPSDRAGLLVRLTHRRDLLSRVRSAARRLIRACSTISIAAQPNPVNCPRRTCHCATPALDFA